MMTSGRNRVYFFTGTGNSLNAARTIANTLPDCELTAICRTTPLELPENCERVGFVFPNYSGGPPSMMSDLIRSMKLPDQADTYLFAVATYGGNAGGVIAQTAAQLKRRSWQLHYGAKVLSYPNAVVAYPMIRAVGLFTRMAERRTRRVAQDLLAKRGVAIPLPHESAQKNYERYMAQIHNSDSGYGVNGDCVSCGICAGVCPAENITLDAGRPTFHHQCESCMACIQHCPKRAINYQDKTQKRGRYTHPNVGYQTIASYYRQSNSGE